MIAHRKIEDLQSLLNSSQCSQLTKDLASTLVPWKAQSSNL